jgi:hypothetical protein
MIKEREYTANNGVPDKYRKYIDKQAISDK